MFVAKPLAETFGFYFWKPLVWDKVAIGMGYHYRARHEFVLFFDKGEKYGSRGKRKLNDLGITRCPDSKAGVSRVSHREARQSSEILISQSTAEGELVVDPFVGSGSVAQAAMKLSRNFAGTD